MYELAAILAGGALAALLLACVHLGFWEQRTGMWLPKRYTIGVACLNAGIDLAALLLGDLRLALVPWFIAIFGGLTVVGLHFWRERRDAPAAKALMRRAFKEYERGQTGGPDPGAD